MPGRAGVITVGGGWFQRPGAGGLGAVGERAGVPAEQQRRGEGGGHAGAEQGPADGGRCLLQRGAGQVGRQGAGPGPGQAAEGVGGEELAPGHLAGTGQERGVGAQRGDEPAEEHHLGAVGIEQIAGGLELALIEADPVPVFAGELVAALVADPIADVVAGDRGRRCHGEGDPPG